jgi:hypothetical protein
MNSQRRPEQKSRKDFLEEYISFEQAHRWRGPGAPR